MGRPSGPGAEPADPRPSSASASPACPEQDPSLDIDRDDSPLQEGGHELHSDIDHGRAGGCHVHSHSQDLNPSHSHSHSHGHSHDHHPPIASQASSAFRWSIALNAGRTAWQLAIGFAGLGRAVDRVPHSVIVGFTAGAAVLIVNSQVRNLFDQAYVGHKESGGPGGSLRFQIPRDSDRYWGVTGRINF